MRKILVLTDFSDNAAKASELAVEFGKKLNANVLLFNSYGKFPTVASYAGGSWAIDESGIKQVASKDHLALIAEDIQNLYNEAGRDADMPTITYLSEEGELGNNVNEISKDRDIELILMGAHDVNVHDHRLFGSDTKSVLRKATRPIFIVPSTFDLDRLNKVVFATDFGYDDIAAVKYLVKLAKLFNFRLDVIHVAEYKKHEDEPNEDEIRFINDLNKLDPVIVSYQLIKGKHVVNRLADFLKETGAGILAMVHQQETFIVDMLRESTTRKVISYPNIPLMIFPSKMMEHVS